MNHTGPILIIEDDPDDQVLLAGVFQELGVDNELIFFPQSQPLIDYLYKTPEKPFLILSDVNLPGMSGLECRRLIEQDDYLRKKSVPFVFYSTSASKTSVEKAYDMMVQGYFKKPSDYPDIVSTIKMIVDYWEHCVHPNNV